MRVVNKSVDILAAMFLAIGTDSSGIEMKWRGGVEEKRKGERRRECSGSGEA